MKREVQQTRRAKSDVVFGFASGVLMSALFAWNVSACEERKREDAMAVMRNSALSDNSGIASGSAFESPTLKLPACSDGDVVQWDGARWACAAAAAQPAEKAHRYYDGCNWHTCVGDLCTETLRGCVGNAPAWYEVSLDEWSTVPLTIEQPETDVTLSIWSREYKRIDIEAPGYTCKRDGKGWVCERGER